LNSFVTGKAFTSKSKNVFYSTFYQRLTDFRPLYILSIIVNNTEL